MKKRVLFLCTHNSARSQMAEGILRHLAGDKFEVFSAGMKKSFVRPFAIKVMQERGIDISKHECKTLDRFLKDNFGYVITVCDSANKACPHFSGARQRLHWSLPDPSQAKGSKAEQLNIYRKIRDTIWKKIEEELLFSI